MRFSYAILPNYPVGYSLEAIQLADRLGFYGVYGADETYHKDMYLLFAAAADKTSRIKFGPSVAPIGLREPTHVCQAIATLDELTNGRTECVISIGNFLMLSQYGIDWAGIKPLSRVKEAHKVMRTFLDEGAITHEGRFFHYNGLFTAARPVQKRVPLLIGAMRGPKSFEAAGELFDGTHAACNYSREAVDYMVEHVKLGAERAGRDWRRLDIGAWMAVVVGPDSPKAKLAAQRIGAFYIAAMPAELLERNGIRQSEYQPILDAFSENDIPKAIELTTPELGDKLAIAGTPEEVVERIQAITGQGVVNHLILGIIDGFIVKLFTGKDVDVPDVKEQLQLVHDKVMPALS
jgi:5,10-methylenetetrahydromethanopterin reductase